MQVQSPARHSRLGIWHCLSRGLGFNCGSDLIPGLGALYATGQPKMTPLKKKYSIDTDILIFNYYILKSSRKPKRFMLEFPRNDRSQLNQLLGKDS